MKSFQHLILNGLIFVALLWSVIGLFSGNQVATDAKSQLIAKQQTPIVISEPNSVGPMTSRPNTGKTPSVNMTLSIAVTVVMGIALALTLPKIGSGPGLIEGELPSHKIRNLIREVEASPVCNRRDARSKAKEWLLKNVTSLDENEILLAKTHFDYLLPAGWGVKA